MKLLTRPAAQTTCIIRTVLAVFLLIGLPIIVTAANDSRRIPVILDTDIGDDIDDTWALGFLLQCPELDLKLVVGDHGKTIYRARLLAKFLEAAGRTDVPVGLGADLNAAGVGPQEPWIADYDLNRYPGRVYPDGVRAMIDMIMTAPEPVTVIAIGPVPNLAVAVDLEPRIAQRARFVGMHGSVRRGYGNSPELSAEYNVKQDVKACQRVFTQPWDMMITPLDTCGIVDLQGERYRQVRDAKNPIARAIMENYGYWSVHHNRESGAEVARTRSSTLFDTVAVYLAYATDLTKVESLPIRVTDDGYTRIDPAGKQMRVATEWHDLEAFQNLLARRLAD